MSVIYCYYTESVGTGGYLSAAQAVPLLDQMLYMYGGNRIAIHPPDADYPATSPETYPSLADAQGAYPNHTWVYLDSMATSYIDELAHPVDNVVYVAGHDLTGYGGETLNGNTFKIRTQVPGFEGHAIVCLSMAVADRWARMKSWL